MICLDNLSPEELIVLTNAITIALAKGKNSTEINALGNFFVAIGSLLTTIAAQQQLLESIQQNNQNQNNQNQNNQNNQQQDNQNQNNQQESNKIKNKKSDK